MRLDTLDPGQRFALPLCGLSGTVERVGVGGVVVRLDRCQTVTVGGRSWQRAEHAIYSRGTDVTLDGEG